MSTSSAAASALAADGTPPTDSASAGVAVSGSHVLKVQGYSLIKGSRVGNFINSSKFSVGGSNWYIRCYPVGWDSECAGWISVALFLLNPDAKTEVKAKYKFSLLDQAEGRHFQRHSKAVDTFSIKVRGRGIPRFIKREKFDKSAYLKDDCLEVRCDVIVMKVPPSDMHLHFGALLSDGGVGMDVTFEVGGEAFAAHRCVLAARSSVFKAELLGPMKEKTETRVKIDDMDPRVFKAMLHFIYTDSLPDMADEGEATVMAQHLLVAADRYGLARLKLICVRELCWNIDRSTVTSTLAIADQHGCHGLKEACFSFLKSPGNLKEITASDDFEHLMKSCPSVLKELFAQLAP